ncbi:MAG: ABC transporter ATP-binding protein [Planctomycetes bacterium]|nr:ABC transporter ATP-binding protein [Planctomycetota bacterium]
MNEPLIQLRGIRRDYRMGEQVLHALDGVDADIEAGEIIALMGASGSGKSTLLNVIGCLDRPTAGSYRLEGREVTQLGEGDRVALRRHKIGFIFQTFHLVPRMTALRNVELPMLFANMPAAERHDRALQTLESVGLAQRVDHRPDQLSGGERQRVAIARAMAMSPSILLADEPTGNLDSASGAEVIRLLLDLNRRGHTILVVTHSAEVAAIGHRLLRMKDGRFV